MTRPRTLPGTRTFNPGPFRWAGYLLIGVAFLSACDLDYPTTTWADQDYDHAALSGGFGLTGPHEGAACTSCHVAGNFEVMFEPANNQDCLACHSADYETRHGSKGYPTTCLTCHTGTTWPRAAFDHGVTGGFAFWGPHTSLECSACHTAGTFAVKFDPSDNQDCVSCHKADYDAQEHASLGYPTTCATCHSGNVWERNPFDHEQESNGFELWGVHTILNCVSCHVPGTFEPRFAPATDQDCTACHG